MFGHATRSQSWGLHTALQRAVRALDATVAIICWTERGRTCRASTIADETSESRLAEAAAAAVRGAAPDDGVWRAAWDDVALGAPEAVDADGAPLRTLIGARLAKEDGQTRGMLVLGYRDAAAAPDLWRERVAQFAVGLELLLDAAGPCIDCDSSEASRGRLSERLSVQSALLSEISEVAQIGGWEVDLSDNTLTWTSGTRRIHQVPRDFTPTVEAAINFYPEEWRTIVAETLRRAIEDRRCFDFEAQLRTAKGRLIWVRAVGKPIVVAGKVRRIVGAFQDISMAKEREDALVRERQRLETILEATQVGTWEWNAVTGQVNFNHQWCRMLGLDPEDAAATYDQWRALVHPHDLKEAEDRLDAHMRGRTDHYSVDFRMRHQSRRWIWISCHGRVVERDRTGGAVRVVGTHKDITERIETNRRLQAEKQRAEAATQAKGRFLATMSHEIRTPLNAVVALTGALARTRLDARQREMVELVESSGNALERVLSDILDFSKIEAGKVEIAVESFDLHHEIAKATDLMRVRADEKALAFDVHYGDTAKGAFEGDAIRIRQILSNLLSNAIKFTEKGRIDVYVDVRESDPCRLTIRVADTGIGFNEEVGARLFNRFQQADGDISRLFGGTGLGLAICKALTELMGGAIGADSTPGAGSVFWFELPLDRTIPLADWERSGAPAAAHEPVDPAAALNAMRILVAEDNLRNQRVIELILDQFNVDLTLVENGAEAIEAFKAERFDIVLMDMQMPEVDGLAATRALRAIEREENRARTPIAMVSANAMGEHVSLAMEAGCDEHLAKPFTPASLLNAIQRLSALYAKAA